MITITMNAYVFGQNDTLNNITDNTINNTNNTTETADVYANTTDIIINLIDGRKNEYTGGMSYTPISYSIQHPNGTVTNYEIGSGYKDVSISDNDLHLSFTIRFTDPQNPGAYSIQSINEWSRPYYVDTLANVFPAYVKDHQIPNANKLYVYSTLLYSPVPGENDIPNRFLVQTSPTDAYVSLSVAN
ncbi:MAG: hypothetical protein R2685_04965 [Candidatus Nitrosocosmicus sp.]|nr:hypothetical protein [Candidatus Nitrosocosmicus sp.]